jgi:hypothetical protein
MKVNLFLTSRLIMSEEQLNEALEPVSLVMRRGECMYCYAEDTASVLIENNFGLKVCDTHKPNAVRDCKAYLHSNHMVRLRDALDHPVVGKFLSELKNLGTFSVERSNLTIQPGWRLKTDTKYWEPAFLNRIDTIWCVPCILEKGHDTMTKQVPIRQFLRDTIIVATPEFHTCITNTLECLEQGLYKSEYDAFQKHRVGTVEEIEGMETILHEGKQVRIFSPETRPKSADTTDPANLQE